METELSNSIPHDTIGVCIISNYQLFFTFHLLKYGETLWYGVSVSQTPSQGLNAYVTRVNETQGKSNNYVSVTV